MATLLFGSNIKLLRQRRGRSQEEVAIALDVKRSSYSGYENGSAEPSFDLLVRMSEYFKVSIDKLLKDELTVVQAQPTVQQTIVKAGLASSNSEANRFIAAGAITLDGEKIQPEQSDIPSGTHLMKRGKNSFAIIERA